MKRKLLALIALVTAISLLLSGCGLLEWMQKKAYHFDNLEYLRPDVTALEISAGECVDSAPKEKDLDALVILIEDFLYLYSDFYTQYALAYVRYCIDTSDTYWEREYRYCAGEIPTVDAARDRVMHALADSPLRKELETEEYFGADYFSDFEDDSIWTEEFTALMEEEAELLNQYYSLCAVADPSIPGSEDYYTNYGEQFEKLYAELVLLRMQIASAAGYDSYPKFAYEYNFHRDFSPGEATAYTEQIRQELVPLYVELAENGGWEVRIEDSTDSQTYAYARQMAENMGGIIETAFEDMTDYGLYHISYSQTKYQSSFEIYIHNYGQPFVFVSPTLTTQDHLTFVHEFGHFCNDYASYGSVAGIDTAEIFSQALEYLSLCYTDSGEELRHYKLLDSLSIYVEQSAYASFEQQVYSLTPEQVTPKTIRSLFGTICREFGFDSWEFDERCYITIPHFYVQPMYVISYVVSNDAAMQLYELELTEKGKGLDIYCEALDTQQEDFLAFLEEAGLQSPFLPGRAAQLHETLKKAISPNTKDVPPGTSLAA